MNSASLFTSPVLIRPDWQKPLNEALTPGALPLDLESPPRITAARGVVLGLALGAGSWAAVFWMMQALRP